MAAVNIPLTVKQHTQLKAYASSKQTTMTKLLRSYIDSLVVAEPTPNFVKKTGWCRPCDSTQFITEERCDTCGEWTVQQ